MAAPMNLLFPICFTTTAATFIAILLLLLPPPTTCFTHPPSPSSPSSDDLSKGQELLIEEKTRLGSRPPSCHNKCNECHPCMAIQVPTLSKRVPTQSRDTIPAAAAAEADHLFHSESSSSSKKCNNRYSNYKPLGWKCRCRNHFYNP